MLRRSLVLDLSTAIGESTVHRPARDPRPHLQTSG